MVETRSWIQREGVYCWFSSLTSAQRGEFLCGLLDLCVPIELRFLGSCLEDLARKDYHSLRDAEIKANNPADLSGLTNITDEVVRSKLLVSLALLGSDNREAAGVLYRTLTHIDTVINNYGLALNNGRTEEQFLLLFTMASNHPAFSFHQKQVLRQQLGQIQQVLQVSGGGGEAQTAGPGGERTAVCYGQQHKHHHHQTACVPLASLSSAACILPDANATYLPLSACHTYCSCCHKSQAREGSTVSGVTGAAVQTKNHQEKAGKVGIERVVLRGVAHKSEDISEYVFEVSWSDGFVSSVNRTQQEVMELLSQLSQVFPDEGVEKFLPQSLELDPRCLTALPCHVLQHHSAQLFFTSTRPPSPICPPSLPPLPSSPLMPPVAPACPFTSSSNTGYMLQCRGSSRAVYRVASVQPVVTPHPSSTLSTRPVLSFSPTHTLSFSSTRINTFTRKPISPPLSQSQAHTPEQNGILDWLRKLRLHKYYPVFKQLTMEEFLALTEEDLNKYDLTQGAKKKLKTQLELQNREMKMEKRSCSGIARVTPSSHMGPSAHPTSSAGELQVEVDAVPHHHPVPRDSSSSSGYSSSSCSPRTPLSRDSTFDRARDIYRRVSGPDAAGVGLEKDRSCVVLLNSSCPTGSSRPTAQASHYPQASYPQTLLSPASNPARILTSPRKPRPPPLCMEDRTKPLGLGLPAAGAVFGSGVGIGMDLRAENLLPRLSVDGSSQLQDSVVCRGLAGGSVGLMVETSCALTSTSNSLHHVSHPPLHFHLSSSSSPSPSGYYSYLPTSSSCSSSFFSFSSSCPTTKSGSHSGSSGTGGGFVPMATPSNVPMAAVPGNSYCPLQSTSSPSPSPSSAPSLDRPAVNQAAGHASSMCVCSSCGCRGNCGAYGAIPGYAATGYLQPYSAGPSLFTLGPLLHLSPLIASSTGGGNGAAPFSYPMMAPPPLYNHSPVSHDQQQGFGFYQPHGILGNAGQKRAAGNLSCYNCGANGHRAEDCKQPPMDSAQQGTFRLKYTPHSDNKDSGD
ncbi:hypothetical protein LDENG_00287440 [Lucifuga dentata]|nr:hypothetical protein LDENG_00287440 [Lucifuga dentata]